MSTPNNDPLGLARVDREIRMERLRQQIEEVTGHEFLSGTSGNLDARTEETYLEQVLEIETRGFTRPFDELVKRGMVLPPPAELDDASLTRKLWELIRAAAKFRLFFHNTDHLSDRELYTWLWHDSLREELMGFGLPFGNCHLDVIGSGSQADIVIWLRYYATPEDRTQWRKDFPEDKLPPREKPPFDRDRNLPQPADGL